MVAVKANSQEYRMNYYLALANDSLVTIDTTCQLYQDKAYISDRVINFTHNGVNVHLQPEGVRWSFSGFSGFAIFDKKVYTVRYRYIRDHYMLWVVPMYMGRKTHSGEVWVVSNSNICNGKHLPELR